MKSGLYHIKIFNDGSSCISYNTRLYKKKIYQFSVDTDYTSHPIWKNYFLDTKNDLTSFFGAYQKKYKIFVSKKKLG